MSEVKTRFTRTERVEWESLPLALRESVAEQIGPPGKVETIVEGRRTPLVAAFTTRSGDRLFVKAAADATRAGEQLAREQAVAPYVTAIAPELLHAVEADGWRLLAFTWVDGARASYMTGSPDIPKVLQALADLDRISVPADVPLMWLDARWSTYAPLPRGLPRLAGPALLHTDLNAGNTLVGAGGARLVDWATASRGARFVNAADFVIMLVAGGHPPREAEAIVGDLPAWAEADPLDIDFFARTVATGWLHGFWNLTNPWAGAVLRAAQRWVMHRLDEA
jgi:hypothetical protein